MNLSLHLEAEGHSYHQRGGVPAEKPVYTNFVTSLTDYPKPTLFKVLTNKNPKPKFFFLSIPHKFTVYLKTIKVACFGYFLGAISVRLLCTRTKVFLCLLLICLMRIFLPIQPKELKRDRGGYFPLLHTCKE